MSFQRQAKLLTSADCMRIMTWLNENTPHPESMDLVFSASIQCGLRIGEIGLASIAAFCDASGDVGRVAHVVANTAKRHRSRMIPMNREMRRSVRRFMKAYPDLDYPAISPSSPSHAPVRMSVRALNHYVNVLYQRMGLEHCSSHSGRRTAITNWARKAHLVGMTLVDVQRLAGHANLSTTARYIDPVDQWGPLTEIVGLELTGRSSEWQPEMARRFETLDDLMTERGPSPHNSIEPWAKVPLISWQDFRSVRSDTDHWLPSSTTARSVATSGPPATETVSTDNLMRLVEGNW